MVVQPQVGIVTMGLEAEEVQSSDDREGPEGEPMAAPGLSEQEVLEGATPVEEQVAEQYEEVDEMEELVGEKGGWVRRRHERDVGELAAEVLVFSWVG